MLKLLIQLLSLFEKPVDLECDDRRNQGQTQPDHKLHHLQLVALDDKNYCGYIVSPPKSNESDPSAYSVVR